MSHIAANELRGASAGGGEEESGSGEPPPPQPMKMNEVRRTRRITGGVEDTES
jgi:hypothetical protein